MSRSLLCWSLALLAGFLVSVGLAGRVGAQWVAFQNQTGTRLVSTPSLGASDVDEKDYAWGDLDNDGDIDLVVVRKQPFTTAGRRANVLFMNEGLAEGHAINGVLVDRTTQYASASDVPGDQGFLTPTNDRDVALADFNLDGWLDIITAPTISDNQPKHIKMPRVYINLGVDGNGAWLGFEYRDAWTPDLSIPTGVPNSSPRFCAVAVGDFTGDGFPDAYFGDYDAQGFGTTIPMLFDYNDRLLINQGGTTLADETTSRFVNLLQPTLAAPQPYYQSTFSASVTVADMNNDGLPDLIKQSSLQDPRFVAISYHNTAAQNFNVHDEVYNQAAYFVSAGDLNNDGLNDLLIVDDFQDRYLLNTGVTGGMANFNSFLLQGSTNEFGGNSWIADLDNDGWNDVIVTDVDVDIAGCSRRMRIFRNLGNAPNVTLIEDPSNQQPWEPNGTHDVAVFDLNGDGWLDMVIGTCTGTQVWINDPPVNIAFSYPVPLPSLLTPNQPTSRQVQLTATGGTLAADSVTLHLSVNGGAYQTTALSAGQPGLYDFTLPALSCSDSASYYLSASLQGGGSYSNPATGPAGPYRASAWQVDTVTLEDFDSGNGGFTVVNSPNLAVGAWEHADPIGTFQNGAPAAPGDDNGGGGLCWVTYNLGGTAASGDVDGGPTDLISPIIDLTGADALIEYAYWMTTYTPGTSTPANDALIVSVWSGSAWVDVTQHPHASGLWQQGSFQVGQHVTPGANVQVRFRIEDVLPGSVCEAGIDDFRVTRLTCGPSQPSFRRGDANRDGGFDISDPVALLGYLFNSQPLGCLVAADGNDDGGLNIADAISLLDSLFGTGGALPAPSAGCGVDPTPDALSCDSFPPCP